MQLSIRASDLFLWFLLFARDSAGNEFERRKLTRRLAESLHPFPRRLGVVLLAEGGGHRFADASASSELGSDRDFDLRKLNGPVWLASEGAEPARRFVVPGSDKEPPFNDHGPDARIAVSSARADADDLGVPQRVEDIVDEGGILRHSRCSLYAETICYTTKPILNGDFRRSSCRSPFGVAYLAKSENIEEFLTGMRPAPDVELALVTALVARMVEEKRSDSQWQSLLERHLSFVRKEIALSKGRAIELTEDRLLAMFDGPARAIRAACAISDSARRLGVKLQSGLHTGECYVTDDQVSGVAIEIAAQVAAESSVGEVLVSSTVKDLVAGSGIRFAERGARVLKGNLGEWRLFAVERGAAA